MQGFLKSILVHLAPSFIPAVTSSPSISFATTSLPVGGITLTTAPSKTTFSSRLNSCNLSGRLSIESAGAIFRGGIPASKHPFANEIISCPTSSGDAKPAVTPVDLTTKSRSLSMSILAFFTDSSIVFLTISDTDSLVSSTPHTVLPKTFSSFFGSLISLVILTVLSRR